MDFHKPFSFFFVSILMNHIIPLLFGWSDTGSLFVNCNM